MTKGFSFFTGYGGSGVIRGAQIAERMGARLNPESGYEDGVCVYVKRFPPDDAPPYTYYDIVDEARGLFWLSRHPKVGIIATSQTAYKYLNERYPGRNIVFVPEHHCNFLRELRTRDEVKVVGVVGHPKSVEFDVADFSSRMEAIGLEFRPLLDKDILNRQTVVDHYKSIDIQVVWRPRFAPDGESRHERNLHNPLKLINAMSFGIPTVAFPELNFTDELCGHFLPANTVDEMVEKVRVLKEDPEAYRLYATDGIEKAEKYHIDNVVKYYKSLAMEERISCSMSGKLYKKKIKVGGEDFLVYGLASYRASPKHRGIGRTCLRALEDIASANGRPVVAFCSDSVLPFYLKCGWFKLGTYEGENLISNVELVDVVVTETW